MTTQAELFEEIRKLDEDRSLIEGGVTEKYSFQNQGTEIAHVTVDGEVFISENADLSPANCRLIVNTLADVISKLKRKIAVRDEVLAMMNTQQNTLRADQFAD